MLSKSMIRQQRNEEKVQQVLRLIANGVPVNIACKKVKITKPTFYHWKRIFVEDKVVVPPSLVQNLYAKRLQEELNNHYELPVTKKECLYLVSQMLGENSVHKYDYEYSEEQNSYIELTHHQLGNGK